MIIMKSKLLMSALFKVPNTTESLWYHCFTAPSLIPQIPHTQLRFTHGVGSQVITYMQ